jgi:hypothetical protein
MYVLIGTLSVEQRGLVRTRRTRCALHARV